MIPIAVLLLLEMAVRISGFSSGFPLFLPVGEHFLAANPDVGRRYFSSAQPPTILADYFRAAKSDTTLRIVVQGGSTAAGFPFYYGGSFPNILEERLKVSVPKRDVEVINVSMAAVNSFTLLDLADEIIATEPDAVLIYAGHNEFFGALGVGSTEYVPGGPAMVRLSLKLQRLRLVQLLKALLSRISSAPPSSEGRMAELARDRLIEYGSPTYWRGVRQFRSNMSRLLRRYEERGIPVYLSTIASNLRDQPPFASTDSTGRPSAQECFRRGRQLLDDGRATEALAPFRSAKDYDGLRFRAPEDMNVVVRDLAQTYGARLVDGYQALADSATFGIIGSDLMTDHLHPTAKGYALLADAFYEHLSRDGFVNRHVPFDADHILLTRVDSLVGALHIADLRSRWPFSNDSTRAVETSRRFSGPIAELGRALYRGQVPWHVANARLIAFYESTQEPELALLAARSRMQELPHLFSSYVPAARLLARAGRYREAVEVMLEAMEADEQPGGHVLLAELKRAIELSEVELEREQEAQVHRP